MLFDPRWEVKAKEPSVADLIAWLSTQNPSTEYDYTSASDCLYVRFIKATTGNNNFYCGPDGIPSHLDKIVHPPYGAGPWREAIRTILRKSTSLRRGWTYGEALKRARKVAVKAS